MDKNKTENQNFDNVSGGDRDSKIAFLNAKAEALSKELQDLLDKSGNVLEGPYTEQIERTQYLLSETNKRIYSLQTL